MWLGVWDHLGVVVFEPAVVVVVVTVIVACVSSSRTNFSLLLDEQVDQ